jgi:hypothetical protein
MRAGEWQMRLEKFFIDEKKPVHVSWWAEQFDVSEEKIAASNCSRRQ